MKKLVIAAALVFGVTGLMLAHTVKAQDANANADTTMNADNGNADNGMNADNAAANAQ